MTEVAEEGRQGLKTWFIKDCDRRIYTEHNRICNDGYQDEASRRKRTKRTLNVKSFALANFAREIDVYHDFHVVSHSKINV